MKPDRGLDRREFFVLASAGAGSLAAATPSMAQGITKPTVVDVGRVENGSVSFPPWRDTADTPSAPPPTPLPPDQRVGFAVVGLGRLSLEQLLPAFGQTKKAKLAALVSGSPDKLTAVAKQYGLGSSACYSYQTFDQIANNPEIKVVYIALPNAMHREFCERSARAAKHVLTEKPMATSVADAKAMVSACAAANVKLMVAYRIQYEPYNRRAMAYVRDKQMGRLVAFNGTNAQTVAPDGAEQWRHKQSMAGGGSLVDIGLYCLNTVRFLTGEEPLEVYASTYSPKDDPRFAQVEETIAFMMRFPSGLIANCLTTYGAREDKHHRLNLEKAVIDMPNAYQYVGQRLLVSSRQGRATSVNELVLPHKHQFAAEIDHMAECVIHDRKPYTPGEEGVQDHIIMEAIYHSASTNRPVPLQVYTTLDTFRGPPPTAES